MTRREWGKQKPVETPGFHIPTSVIPGRRNGPSPESITADARDTSISMRGGSRTWLDLYPRISN
jgi:hypothetical protein